MHRSVWNMCRANTCYGIWAVSGVTLLVFGSECVSLSGLLPDSTVCGYGKQAGGFAMLVLGSLWSIVMCVVWVLWLWFEFKRD
jgi:hypothetical protein